jgi:hypothetical protein
LKGIEAFLGISTLDVPVTSNLLDSSSKNGFSKPSFLDDRCNGGIFNERKEKMILSKIGVMHGFLLFLCFVQDLESSRAKRNFIGSW